MLRILYSYNCANYYYAILVQEASSSCSSQTHAEGVLYNFSIMCLGTTATRRAAWLLEYSSQKWLPKANMLDMSR